MNKRNINIIFLFSILLLLTSCEFIVDSPEDEWNHDILVSEDLSYTFSYEIESSDSQVILTLREPDNSNVETIFIKEDPSELTLDGTWDLDDTSDVFDEGYIISQLIQLVIYDNGNLTSSVNFDIEESTISALFEGTVDTDNKTITIEIVSVKIDDTSYYTAQTMVEALYQLFEDFDTGYDYINGAQIDRTLTYTIDGNQLTLHYDSESTNIFTKNTENTNSDIEIWELNGSHDEQTYRYIIIFGPGNTVTYAWTNLGDLNTIFRESGTYDATTIYLTYSIIINTFPYGL